MNDAAENLLLLFFIMFCFLWHCFWKTSSICLSLVWHLLIAWIIFITTNLFKMQPVIHISTLWQPTLALLLIFMMPLYTRKFIFSPPIPCNFLPYNPRPTAMFNIFVLWLIPICVYYFLPGQPYTFIHYSLFSLIFLPILMCNIHSQVTPAMFLLNWTMFYYVLFSWPSAIIIYIYIFLFISLWTVSLLHLMLCVNLLYTFLSYSIISVSPTFLTTACIFFIILNSLLALYYYIVRPKCEASMNYFTSTPAIDKQASFAVATH